MVQALRVRDIRSEGGQGGEVLSCVYSSDGAFVLSAGWDGCLRLWQPSPIQLISSLHASLKPLSACAFAPGGMAWVCSSMDGTLSWWDAVSHERRQSFIAHIRPISAIQFSPDGRYLATASWDRKLALRRVGNENPSQALNGHRDIVAGCRWSTDSRQLLSWSHDSTLRLWDADSASQIAVLGNHSERVTTACLSGDGQWAVSGSRDGVLKLWDLRRYAEVRSMRSKEEIRGCWFLGDGTSLLTVHADGWMGVWSAPDLEIQAELANSIRPTCSDLSPNGTEIVLGDDKGQLLFVALDGAEQVPLPVTALPSFKPKSGVISRFLAKRKGEQAYRYTCPACGQGAELASLPCEAISCGSCHRLLRVNTEMPQLQPL